MMNVLGRSSSSRRLLRRVRSIWPLTVRQRIFLYLVLGALAGLACAGVDYSIDANKMACDLPASSEADCSNAATKHSCASFSFANGTCHVSGCFLPCDGTATTNCPFGKTNGGAAWTQADCKQKGLIAGCTNGTLYSIGCWGYSCTDQRCGRH